MKSIVFFADEKVKKAFLKLKGSDGFDRQLYKWIARAGKDLEEDCFCGVQIKKELIPVKYRKYALDNLWKYDLPKGWRLIYTVSGNDVKILSIVLEWLSHPDYERRFRY